MDRIRKKSVQGFSLPEILVAMAVFSLTLLALISLFTSVQYSQRTAKYIDIAKNSATSQIETMYANPDAVSEGTVDFTSSLPNTLPSGATGTAVISSAVGITGMKNVDVTVHFVFPSGFPRDVKMTALIGTPG